MLVGYARVSTHEQNPALQADALKQAGCQKIFEDKISGAKAKRPGLAAALNYVRRGDTLLVWRLDRLARSLQDLIAIIGDLEKRGVIRRRGPRLKVSLPLAQAEFEADQAVDRFDTWAWLLREIRQAL